MTVRREGATTWVRAAVSWGEDAARWALVNDPRPRRAPRDAAFAAYLREVRRTMRQPAQAFEVMRLRALASGAASEIVEITLRDPGLRIEPGDMLQLWWENAAPPPPSPDDTAPLAYWTTPLPHRPSRRAHATADELRRRVIDLGDAPVIGVRSGPLTGSDAAAFARVPRITPRFYTVSGVAGDEVCLQVTRAAAWPERAAAYLHRLRPGDHVRGWVLRHPHRIDRTRPGLVVATGSGAAGAFAALRAGARGIRLVWGLGDKRLAPWVERELDEHAASGRLARVELARSPQRVTDVLVPQPPARRALDAAGGRPSDTGTPSWAEAVDAILTGVLGSELARAHAELRYIVSA